MTRNAYLRSQVPVNFCQNSYCLRNVCKVSAHFIFLFIRHTNKGNIFCVWGLVLAAQVGRTATKLSYVTQNSLHFIASRRHRRHFECHFFKSPHYVPPGIRWEDDNGVGDGQQLYFLPGLTHSVSRKDIALLLNQIKFEKTDKVFIKGIHSGLWQNFVSLLAQMVVEQEAEKLFSQIFYCCTFLGKSNHGHFLKQYLLNYNFAERP